MYYLVPNTIKLIIPVGYLFTFYSILLRFGRAATSDKFCIVTLNSNTVPVPLANSRKQPGGTTVISSINMSNGLRCCDPSNDIVYISFNQDSSCVSVGTRVGYRIYNCEPFGKSFHTTDGGIGIVQMLFCTSLIALVGAGEQPAFSPRRLRIWNAKTSSAMCDLNFVTAVLSIQLNRKRLVAVLEKHIYIYDIGTMKILETLDTTPNPKGMCVLSPNEKNGHMAFPTGSNPGEILIFDTNSLSVINVLHVSQTSPVAIALNSNGNLLAAASETGTLIRIFELPSGNKVNVFRRGVSGAEIYSLGFSPSSSFLCVSSSTGTVHVFSLNNTYSSHTGSFPISSISTLTSSLPAYIKSIGSSDSSKGSTSRKGQALPSSQPFSDKKERDENKDSITTTTDNAPSSAVVGTFGYVSSSFGKMVEGKRDFAFCRLRDVGIPNLCAVVESNQDGEPIVKIRVVTINGYFFEYGLNLKVGGECRLERVRLFLLLLVRILVANVVQKENVLHETSSEAIGATYLH